VTYFGNDKGLEKVDHFSRVEIKLRSVEEKLTTLEARFYQLKAEVGGLRAEVRVLKASADGYAQTWGSFH